MKKVDLRMSKGKGKEKEGESEMYLQVRLPTAKRHFKAALYGDMVQKGFASLYGDTNLSDITLVLGDEKIPVHRIVLSVWSEPFRTMMEKVPKGGEVVIPLQDPQNEQDRSDFKLLLRHMYTGDTDFISSSNVLSLLSLSSYFDIHSLKEACGELLGELVTDDNLFFFLDVVDKYEVRALEAACGSHLAEHFQDLVANGKLDDLEPSTWAEIVKTDDIRVKSEEELFEAVIAYVNQSRFKNDRAARESALTTILPHVRFPFMSPKFLVTKVEADDSISSLDVVQDLLHEAYRYSVSPSSVKNARTTPRKGHRFDSQQVNSALTLSDDRLKVSLSSSPGWVNVSTTTPLTINDPYIEFNVENGTSGQLMIGVVAGTVSNSGYSGQYSNGWTYYSSGQVYNSGNTPASGPTYNTGDKIGIFVEFDKATVHFYKNGKSATSVSNVTISETSLLYPNVSLNAQGNCVSVIPFAPLPQEARSKLSSKATNNKDKDNKGAVGAVPQRQKRAKLTASSLGRTYGDGESALDSGVDTMLHSSGGDEDGSGPESIEGATFIKRFLRFKF